MWRLFEGGIYFKVGRDKKKYCHDYDIVIFRITLTE